MAEPDERVDMPGLELESGAKGLFGELELASLQSRCASSQMPLEPCAGSGGGLWLAAGLSSDALRWSQEEERSQR